MKRLLIIPVFFLFVGAAAGQKNVQFSALDKTTYTYQDLVTPHQVILMFWTSRCFYCRQEFEKLNKINLDTLGSPIMFVNLGESPASIREFLKKYRIKTEISQKIVMDPDLFTARTLGVMGVPTYVFFQDEEIVYKTYRLYPEQIKEIFSHE